jgi:integrase
MTVIWIKEKKFLGVRYREHATRKYGVKFDRCFSIRYKLSGKDKEEVVGWSSEGLTAKKAFKLLSCIRENIKLGREPQSVAATRQAGEAKDREEAWARREKDIEHTTTFADFWDSTYLPTAMVTKTARTVQGEIGLYRNWVRPALGDIPLRRIDISKVEAVALGAAKAGKSAATIRYILKIISQVWNKAVTRDLVQGDCPTRRVKKPQLDNRRERFLTEQEATDLLAALAPRSRDMHDIALLALFCGLRAGEIHALTWGDLDMDNGLIQIMDPKNKINRHAFMPKEILAMLEGRQKAQVKSDLVFPGLNGQERQWVSDTFSRTVEALGLNDTGELVADKNGNQVPVKIKDARQRVVFHTLRHTFASWLVKKGTPLYTVAELMGHTTLEMTRRYSHLAPDTLRQAALSLEGQLEQKPASILPFKRAAAS